MCWLCTRSQTVSKVAPSVVCESCISPLGRRRRLYTRSGGLEENIVDTLLSGISLYPFSSLRCSEQRGRCYFFVRPLVLDWITISSIIIAVAAGEGVDVHHPGRRNTVPSKDSWPCLQSSMFVAEEQLQRGSEPQYPRITLWLNETENQLWIKRNRDSSVQSKARKKECLF